MVDICIHAGLAVMDALPNRKSNRIPDLHIRKGFKILLRQYDFIFRGRTPSLGNGPLFRHGIPVFLIRAPVDQIGSATVCPVLIGKQRGLPFSLYQDGGDGSIIFNL